MGNHHLKWFFPRKIVIFHSYVSLPEGNLEHDQPHQLSRVRLFIFSPCSQVLLIQMSWCFLVSQILQRLFQSAPRISVVWAISSKFPIHITWNQAVVFSVLLNCLVIALKPENDRKPTRWCPPVLCWFINHSKPINYSYIYHKHP